MLNVLICDDDSSTLYDIINLTYYYEDANNVQLNVIPCSSCKDAMSKKSIIDIAVLDIELHDDINGIELGAYLKANNNSDIELIYSSSYREYIDDAMDVGIVRFLDKPFSKERYFKGLEKAIKNVDALAKRVRIRTHDRIVTVNEKDIILAEVENHGTKLLVGNNMEYHAVEPISYWVAALDKNIFAVPHKSYIVNMNCISSYRQNEIQVNSQIKISVARKKQSSFRKKYYSFMADR